MGSPLIVLLTDFGLDDPYVGIMKGVISSIVPGIPMIDLNHHIPPGDIKRAAVTLWQSIDYFPRGSIFLCVIDPGVGTSRRGLILQARDRIFIGPDNGIFSLVLEQGYKAWSLEDPAYQLPMISSTFHGRDIFAPAAAYAAIGIQGHEFGQQILSIQLIKKPTLTSVSDHELNGEILFSDRFGNLLTSLGRFTKSSRDTITFTHWQESGDNSRKFLEFRTKEIFLKLENGIELPWADTFAEVAPGECAFLIGSSGLLEIVANRLSAANILRIDEGSSVLLQSKRSA